MEIIDETRIWGTCGVIAVRKDVVVDYFTQIEGAALEKLFLSARVFLV